MTFTDSTLRWNNDRDEARYAVLYSPKRTAVVNARRARADLSYFFTTGRWFRPGGRAFIAYEWFNPGCYRLYLLERSKAATRLLDTGQMVNNRSVPTRKWLQ